MSQISPPIRILLVAVIGLIAVYMLFLRPKTEEAVPAAAAPAAATPVPAKDPDATTASKPGSIVQQAVTRHRLPPPRTPRPPPARPSPSPRAAPPTPPLPVDDRRRRRPRGGSATASRPSPRRRCQRCPRTSAAPSRSTRWSSSSSTTTAPPTTAPSAARSRRSISYGGQVFVDAHWIKSVSRYQAITRGVDVEQSPTIVVADRNLKAETLVGYVDDRDDRPGRRGRAPRLRRQR